MTAVVFVDLETTGLDAKQHEIWEAAAVKVDGGHITTAHWFVNVSLINADQKALKVGGFAERWDKGKLTSAYDFIGEFGEFTEGLQIAANNVAFDMSFLKNYWSVWFFGSGKPEPWHYSPIDVKSYAAGVLGMALPLPKSSVIGEALNCTKNNRPHHAMADAYYAKELFEEAQARFKAWNP